MKKVTKSNKKFKAMTPAQKRVAIAKDVIKQIKLEKFLVSRGNFVTVRNGINPDPDYFDQKYLKSKAVQDCKVCAIGAAIVSGIRLFNKVKFDDSHIEPDKSWRLITHFFDPKQAVLIENAFEVGHGYYNDSQFYAPGVNLPTVSDLALQKAIEFGEQFGDETERAQQIFQNIINNKGVFKP